MVTADQAYGGTNPQQFTPQQIKDYVNNNYNGGAGLGQIYSTAQNYGVSGQDIANAMGVPLSSVNNLLSSHGYQPLVGNTGNGISAPSFSNTPTNNTPIPSVDQIANASRITPLQFQNPNYFGSHPQYQIPQAFVPQQFNQPAPQYNPYQLQSMRPEDITNDAGYQFRLQEGARLLNQQEAASGNFFSGQRGRDLQQYAQGMAADEYQNAWSRNIQQQLANYNTNLQNFQTKNQAYEQQFGNTLANNQLGLQNWQAAAGMGLAGTSALMNQYNTENQLSNQYAQQGFNNTLNNNQQIINAGATSLGLGLQQTGVNANAVNANNLWNLQNYKTLQDTYNTRFNQGMTLDQFNASIAQWLADRGLSASTTGGQLNAQTLGTLAGYTAAPGVTNAYGTNALGKTVGPAVNTILSNQTPSLSDTQARSVLGFQ